MPALKTNYHSTLASYFASKRLYLDEPTQKKPNIRKLVEQPWQQTKSEMWDEVTDTLSNLDFIQAKAAAKMTYDLVNDFNAALKVIPDNAENIRKEKERQARMDKYSRDLILYAKGEIKELEVPESISPWTKEEYDAEIERIKTNPNRADQLKDFINFLGQEANNLKTYAEEFPHFATQQAWNYAAEGPVGKAAEKGSIETNKSLLLRSRPTRPSWNPFPQSIKTLWDHNEIVRSVAITPDCKWAVSGGQNNECILWNLTNGQVEKTLKGHSDIVVSIAITPDGQRAISGSVECILWDMKKGEPLKILLERHSGEVSSVAISPDGKKAIAISHKIYIWDIESREKIKILPHPSDYAHMRFVSISCDWKRAISLNDGYHICVWDLINENLINEFSIFNESGHSDLIEALCITPDGKMAVSGCRDGSCILWDLEYGKPIKTLKGHTKWISAICITADGKKAITCSFDSTCILWDLESGNMLQTLFGHSLFICSISVTPDGKYLFSGSGDYTCMLWEMEKGRPIKRSQGHKSSIHSVSTEFIGTRALTGSQDGNCIRVNAYNFQ